MALGVTRQPSVVENVDEQSVRVDCNWYEETHNSSVQLTVEIVAVMVKQSVALVAVKLIFFVGSSCPGSSGGMYGGFTTGGTGNGMGTMGGSRPQLCVVLPEPVPIEVGGR